MDRLFRYVRESENNGNIAFLKKVYGEGIFNSNQEAYKPGTLYKKALDREIRMELYDKNSVNGFASDGFRQKPNVRYNEDLEPIMGFDIDAQLAKNKRKTRKTNKKKND
jgi:hypothetical protein